MAARSARQRRGAAMDDSASCGDVEQDAGGESKRGHGGSNAPAPADAAEAPFSLDGDRASLALLLLLYTLQGVPMGLASSVSFALQERGGSYADQGACAPRRCRTRSAPCARLAARVGGQTVWACAAGAPGVGRGAGRALRLRALATAACSLLRRRLQLRLLALLAQDPLGAPG